MLPISLFRAPSGTISKAQNNTNLITLEDAVNQLITDVAAATAAAAAAAPLPIYATDATANHNLAAIDLGNLTGMTSGSANTVTVRPDATYSPAVNQEASFVQIGAGQTTFVAGSGVTILATPGLKLRAQGSAATLKKLAANTYLLVGDLAA